MCMWVDFLGLTLTREWLINRPTALAQSLVTVAGPLPSANLVRWSSGVWHMGQAGTPSALCLLIHLMIVCCSVNTLFSTEALLPDCSSTDETTNYTKQLCLLCQSLVMTAA